MEKVIHEFGPVFDENSKVLVLGTIPSPKSRELGFYYCHPQNRFWRVMAALFQDRFPDSVPQKREFALRHQIALWDVLAECVIKGASDGSIREEIPNDLDIILKAAPIQAIFTTGKKAEALYRKYCLKYTGIESVCLPSTSPANCACSFDKLLEAYKQILTFY